TEEGPRGGSPPRGGEEASVVRSMRDRPRGGGGRVLGRDGSLDLREVPPRRPAERVHPRLDDDALDPPREPVRGDEPAVQVREGPRDPCGEDRAPLARRGEPEAR